MNIAGKAIVLGAFLVAFTCCAQKPPEFYKVGISKNVVKRDSNRCWKYAQTSNETKAAVAAGAGTTVAIGLLTANPGIVVGGLIGQGINESSPKSATKQAVHNSCMHKKGYKIKKG